MKIEVAKYAQREFEESKEYYELQQRGLGARFENEFKDSWFISGNPKKNKISRATTRDCPYKSSDNVGAILKSPICEFI